VLEGSVEIDGKTLGRRDGLGVWDTESIAIMATEDARFLLMEVPMQW
jgi:redox-sensitive bicupin YhaK (pirin superfamily)